MLWDACELGLINELSDMLNQDKSNFPLDINSKSLDDWTALHLASNENNYQIIDILLNNGGNVEAQTTIKRTALHIAAFRGYLKIVQTSGIAFRMRHGTNIDWKIASKTACLSLAAF